MAIKHLILDMGNVLLGWTPEAFALRAAGNEADANILSKALFASPDWHLHDAGQITEEELLHCAQARTPQRLQAQLINMFNNWPAWMEPIPRAEEICQQAKAAGLGLYLLSNAGVHFPDALRTRPFYPLFDGMVVSYHEKVCKPDAAIYQLLCDRYALQPAECLFVDDLPHNAEGARAAGMQAFHFEGDWQPVWALLSLG